MNWYHSVRTTAVSSLRYFEYTRSPVGPFFAFVHSLFFRGERFRRKVQKRTGRGTLRRAELPKTATTTANQNGFEAPKFAKRASG
jgi:hypothetical protein